MAIGIGRRKFIVTLGSAAAWPLAAHAQQPAMPVIGYLGLAPASSAAFRLAAMRAGLHDLGFADGNNVAIESRWAEGPDQLREFATELVQRRAAVIVTSGNAATLAVKSATSAIPIIFAAADDPVRLGLVASFNQPGGNITGISMISGALGAKRLELLRELVPKATLIALLTNPNNPADANVRDEQTVARASGQRILPLSAATDGDLETAFAELVQQRASAISVSADAAFTARRDQIVALAARYGIPAIYPWREYTESGGLMSYGTNLTDAYHQVGVYVGRILKGEKPADLPVIQPTKFELVINLKTAKALGLTVPQTLQVAADEVIE
jgi:putative tryptophan/tyrosine transport system substrate-binding protein